MDESVSVTSWKGSPLTGGTKEAVHSCMTSVRACTATVSPVLPSHERTWPLVGGLLSSTSTHSLTEDIPARFRTRSLAV